MIQVVFSLLVNLALALIIVAVRMDGNPTAYAVFGSFWAFNLIGSVLYLMTRKSWAFIIAGIGFVLFVPVGIIGIKGLQNLKEEDDYRNYRMKMNEQER